MKRSYRIANRFRFTLFVVCMMIIMTTAFNFAFDLNTADSLTMTKYRSVDVL